MSRKLFTAGCVVLIALGLVHTLGHYMMTTSQGETDAERQLLAVMRANPQDMGLGMLRTMFDIVTGFSLTLSILPLGMGIVGLVVRRHAAAAPGLLSQVAIVYAGTYGVMTGVALRYWFPAPLVFLAVAFLCFAAAVATAPRA
jgi:uncharacterized membrane protein